MEILRIVNGDLETNSYLIIEGNAGLVIDPATKIVKDKVDDLHLDVVAVINTHGHFDHIGGNKFFSCPLYIHVLDAPMLTDPELNLSSHFFLSVFGRLPDYKLNGDQELTIGPFQMKILHTPGHTPGSICLWLANALFTGDTLFKGSVGRTDLPGGDYEALRFSLRKIISLPENLMIYPGHGEVTTLKEEIETNPFLCEIL